MLQHMFDDTRTTLGHFEQNVDAMKRMDRYLFFLLHREYLKDGVFAPLGPFIRFNFITGKEESCFLMKISYTISCCCCCCCCCFMGVVWRLLYHSFILCPGIILFPTWPVVVVPSILACCDRLNERMDLSGRHMFQCNGSLQKQTDLQLLYVVLIEGI